MLVHLQQPEGKERACSLSEFEEMVRGGAIRPHSRVRYAPMTGEAFVEARQLELYRSIFDAPDMQLRRAWTARTIPWMTALIVGLEFRVFFWTHMTVWEEGLIGWMARWTPGIVEGGQTWRLFSYGLLHGSVPHVVMNMLFIVYAGVALESMFGAANLLLLFVVGVVSGGALSSIFMLDSQSIGASAGDFGLMGACVVFGWRYYEIIPKRARPAFGAMILAFTLYVLLGSFGSEGVDYWGHLGGLVGGAVLTPMLRPLALAGAARHNRIVQGVCGVLLVALFGGGAVLGPEMAPWIPLAADGVAAARPLLWKAGWSDLGQSAWRSPVDTTTISLTTDHFDQATTIEEEQHSLLLRLQSLDPAAKLTSAAPESHADQPGQRLRARWTGKAGERHLEGWIAVRGHYVHEILVEGGDPEEVGRRLDRVLHDLSLGDPEEVAALRKSARGSGWRDQVALAQAEQALGRQAEARALLAAAMAATEEEEPALAMLGLLRDPPVRDGQQQIAEIRARFPDSRKIQAEVARTLVAIGDPNGAEALLRERLGRWPGDKRLSRAWRELFSLEEVP